MKEKIVVEISALSDIERMTIGEMVCKIREDKGLSQKQVAKIGKVSLDTVARIERGENTTTDKLYKVAKGLSVKLGSLIPPEDREPSQPPACTEYNADHMVCHSMLEEILHGSSEEWRDGIVANLRAMVTALRASPQKPPDISGKRGDRFVVTRKGDGR